MRRLNNKEVKKHGCYDCLHQMSHRLSHRQVEYLCPFEKCPYYELDDYSSYNDYLNEREEIDIL